MWNMQPWDFQNKKISTYYTDVSTSNHMFKREILDKFTEFTFLKFSKILKDFEKWTR